MHWSREPVYSFNSARWRISIEQPWIVIVLQHILSKHRSTKITTAGPKQGSPAEFCWLCRRCGTWSWQCWHLPSQRTGCAWASRISVFFAQFILRNFYHRCTCSSTRSMQPLSTSTRQWTSSPISQSPMFKSCTQITGWSNNRARWWFTIIKCRAANTIGDTVTVNKVLEQFNEAVEKFPK